MNDSYTAVRITLRRIQTFLLESPRLRAMVGANALLGETLRGRWDGAGFAREPASLPALAVEWGAAGVPELADPAFELRTGDREVFSLAGGTGEPAYQDDPHAVASRTGVLSRDGGHFEALFADGNAARGFAEAARRLLRARLPGLPFSLTTRELVREGSRLVPRSDGRPRTQPRPAGGRDVLDIPQAFVCELSGRELARGAQFLRAETGGIEELRKTGAGSGLRLERGEAFDRGRTADVLGILNRELLERLGPDGGEVRLARRLDELAPDGYLAVIHADGNGVGARFHSLRGQASDDHLAEWRVREEFFYRLRSGMRVATLEAIAVTFGGTGDVVPVRPLMLGGDDLLLVCDAARALPFAVALAQRVHAATADVPAGGGARAPLSLGAGVALVPVNFPFHRAHALAEALAKSAKRISRSGNGAGVSTVDWALVTESWHDDLERTRRRDMCWTAEGRVWALTGRPYPIRAADSAPGGGSLEQLLADARRLNAAWRAGGVARSQRKELARAFDLGRYAGQFAVEALPARYRALLQELGYVDGHGDPWFAVEGGGVCRVLDLIEVAELTRDAGPDRPGEPVAAAAAAGKGA